MRIGIDFDNTIINYDEVFLSLARQHGFITAEQRLTKNQIRDAIIERYGNDLNWQKLQAIAYGPGIFEAVLFDDVNTVLSSWREQGHQLFIVSHKSQSSHYDASVDLRAYAWQWLKRQQLLFPGPVNKQQVYFCDDLSAKVAKINALDLDVFIDDLARVIDHPEFPETTVAIGFGTEPFSSNILTADSWQRCEQICQCLDTIGLSAIGSWQNFERNLPVAITRFERSGNNQIFKVNSETGASYLLKRYFHDQLDSRNRGATEFTSLSFLTRNGVNEVPQVYDFNEQAQLGYYALIKGRNQLSIQDSEQTGPAISEFIIKLKKLYLSADTSGIANASDARFSFADYFDKIEHRLSQIRQGCRMKPELAKVAEFVEGDVVPFKEKVLQRARRQLAQYGYCEHSKFANEQLTLNPSDLGPHNMLIDDLGNCAFIDFEYFGIDDEVKMLADLFHHAQQKLTEQAKWHIFQQYLNASDDQDNLKRRFDIVIDLIGVEWLLIVLNIAAPGTIARRQFANRKLNVGELIRQRLTKAQDMLAKFHHIALQDGQYLTVQT